MVPHGRPGFCTKIEKGDNRQLVFRLGERLEGGRKREGETERGERRETDTWKKRRQRWCGSERVMEREYTARDMEIKRRDRGEIHGKRG